MVPAHLRDLKEVFSKTPRKASLKWFSEAGLGLFLHYGIYALHKRGEWALFNEAIPLSKYEGLADSFTAEKFDPDFITDLAAEMGAKYVNFTAKHHDGFCLWDSSSCDFNSTRTPSKRDLVGELSEQCRNKGLGFFVYYSYALDWRHPWFFSLDFFDKAQPPYANPEPRYLFKKAEDFRRYIDYARAQLTELLTWYGPVAGVWFDPEMAYFAQPDLFALDETYALIRRLQPHALIAFKHGATGTEDFAAPEGRGAPVLEKIRARIGENAARRAAKAWAENEDKPGEICDTLSWSWGYHEKNDTTHIGPQEVLEKYVESQKRSANLLINTAPLPDGSIPRTDIKTLREAGRCIRAGELPSGRPFASFTGDTSTPIA